MTNPVPHGYPDYGRTLAQADLSLVNDGTVSINADKSYGVIFIGNYRSLFVHCVALTNPVRIRLRWCLDASGVTSIGDTTMELRQNDRAEQPVRVIAPYVEVIAVVGAATPVVYELEVWSSPDYGSLFEVTGDIGNISVTGGAIGAGATVDTESLLVQSGHAIWVAFCNGGNFTAQLRCVPLSGTSFILDQFGPATTAHLPRPVYLPAGHIRIRMINNAAGAQTFDAYLTRQRN